MPRAHRIAAILSLFVTVLLVTSWVRHHDPAAEVAARQAELEAAEADNAALTRDVEALEDRLEALEDGETGLEREARDQFPLVGDGEVLYLLDATP